MRWLRAWFSRLGGILGRNRLERELAAELESHLQLLALCGAACLDWRRCAAGMLGSGAPRILRRSHRVLAV